MKSKLVMCLAAIALLFSAGTGSAGPISFTLAGTTNTIDSFVFNTNNFVAHNAIPATVGSTFNFYYQSTVSAAQLNGLNVNFPALNSTHYITLVAGVTEQVKSISVAANGDSHIDVVLAPAALQTVNYLKMYDTTTAPNEKAGTGYNNVGTLILSGTLTKDASSFADNVLHTVPFVISPATQNGYTTKKAAANAGGPPFNSPGNGSASLTAAVTFANSAYFNAPSGMPTITLTLFKGSDLDQFNAVSPTKQFVTSGVDGTVKPNLGAINGVTGPDILFQVDASQSFQTAAVPEPASISLALLGAGGLALARIRRRRQTAL